MSDYQVTNYGICGECKWQEYSELFNEWRCVNEDSEHYTLYADYTDTCEEWSERGIE